MDRTSRFKANHFLITCSLAPVLVLCGMTATVAQTDVGETLAAWGRVGFSERVILTPDSGALGYGDSVFLEDRISTGQDSNVAVLLINGHKIEMGRVAGIKLRADEVELETGTIRVLPQSSTFATATPSGGIATANSGFITSCGPPRTTAVDVCLFVGVYGLTTVTAQGVSVVLTPQWFTTVNPGQVPTEPRAMEASLFLSLSDETSPPGWRRERLDPPVRQITTEPPGYTPQFPGTEVPTFPWFDPKVPRVEREGSGANLPLPPLPPDRPVRD